MQLSAMQLQRASPSDISFTFWYALSIVLQASSLSSSSLSSSSSSPNPLFGLAEKILERYIKPTFLLKDSNQLLYFIDLLQRQHKYHDALALVSDSSPALHLFQPADTRLELKAQLLVLLNSPEHDIIACDTFALILTQYRPDDWNMYQSWFSVLARLDPSVSPIASAFNIVSSLCSQHPNIRGPHLALIDLCLRFPTFSISSSSSSSSSSSLDQVSVPSLISLLS